VCSRIRAGNIYVNRNIIGAVVGVQPFGGEALSGTGPKAGGPHYVWRLVREPRPPRAGDEVTLSGPTGETNTLLLRPRGRVACLAATEAELTTQARMATQLGNTALLTASAAATRVCAEVGSQCMAVRTHLPPRRMPCCSQGPTMTLRRCASGSPRERDRSFRWSCRATVSTTLRDSSASAQSRSTRPRPAATRRCCRSRESRLDEPA
jgi:hypothetical protein